MKGEERRIRAAEEGGMETLREKLDQIEREDSHPLAFVVVGSAGTMSRDPFAFSLIQSTPSTLTNDDD